MKRMIFFVIAAILLYARPVQAQTEAVCSSPYTVAFGESLGKIARKCQVSLRAIIQANPHIPNPDLLFVGETLTIPDPSQPAAPPASEATEPASGWGETEPASAPEYLAEVDNQAEAEAQEAAPVEEAPPVAPEEIIPETGSSETSSQMYTIQRGDTLGKIAKRTGTTVTQILLANASITDPNRVYVGQTIRIPAPGEVFEVSDWLEERLNQAAGVPEFSEIYRPKSDSERWIYVDLATQTTHAFEGNRVVRSFLVSTGTSRYPTVTGQYKIWIKYRYDDMEGPGYYLKDVPYVMYFYKGYGLHGTYWHNNFGTPMSHGCVNLTIDDAQWLFDWASVGTVVVVQ